MNLKKIEKIKYIQQNKKDILIFDEKKKNSMKGPLQVVNNVQKKIKVKNPSTKNKYNNIKKFKIIPKKGNYYDSLDNNIEIDENTTVFGNLPNNFYLHLILGKDNVNLTKIMTETSTTIKINKKLVEINGTNENIQKVIDIFNNIITKNQIKKIINPPHLPFIKLKKEEIESKIGFKFALTSTGAIVLIGAISDINEKEKILMSHLKSLKKLKITKENIKVHPLRVLSEGKDAVINFLRTGKYNLVFSPKDIIGYEENFVAFLNDIANPIPLFCGLYYLKDNKGLGVVIGKRGANIKKLTISSGVRNIKVNSEEQLIEILGLTLEKVKVAVQNIQNLLIESKIETPLIVHYEGLSINND